MSENNSKSDYVPSIQLVNVHGVAYWNWNLQNEVCAICRNPIIDYCIECLSDETKNQENGCPISQGVCQHAFHHHCIEKWLNTRYSCPLCNVEWNYQQEKLEED